MSRSRADLTALVVENSTALARSVTDPMVRYLLAMRSVCGDDLDTALILLIIMQRANQHPDYARIPPATIVPGTMSQLPTLKVNVRSIADSTGIPKETVRRKINRLIELGLVARDDGMVRFTPEGYQGVAPAREALVKLVVQLVEAVDQVGSRLAPQPTS